MSSVWAREDRVVDTFDDGHNMMVSMGRKHYCPKERHGMVSITHGLFALVADTLISLQTPEDQNSWNP